MPADHEIEVKFDGTHAIPVLPGNLKVPETVHYSSTAGEVKILFVDNGSPFTDANGHNITEITSAAAPLPLSKKSDTGFTCRCFITLKNGMTVGWDPIKSPQSGGNHIVK